MSHTLPRRLLALLAGLSAGAGLSVLPGPARAERLVPGWDPRTHAKPPIQRGLDGEAGPLLLDADFLEAARRAPRPVRARGGITRSGEVLVVQGDDELIATTDAGFGVRSLPALARRVIEAVGDQFHTITVWLTFDDRASPRAEAYESTVRTDVAGLGLPLRDLSRQYGSAGVLRSIVNMKTIAHRAGETAQSWAPHLETWGQESAHRWTMFFKVRDPRHGRVTDILLGRDCAHFSAFVDSQASVQDGVAWKDNGDGSFTWTERNKRFGDLDLYGMGLLAPDEVPSFFFIDDIPGYTHPGCNAYSSTRRPSDRTIRGTRVDVGIDDIIAANGPRVPAAGELLDGQPQDYVREVEVVLTAPNQALDNVAVVRLAERIDRARLFWEQWNGPASGNRRVVCTKISADCGDPRSDVSAVRMAAAAGATARGPFPVEVELTNGGSRPATGVKVTVVGRAGEASGEARRDVGALGPGETKTATLSLDVPGVACGAEIEVKATSQSDFHVSRGRTALLVGVETKVADGFEEDGGWRVDPDGDDGPLAARWQRGAPEATDLLGRPVQPAGARTGRAAWVTGLAAAGDGARDALVTQGKATLESPVFALPGVRDAQLRYWVSFAGVRLEGGQRVEPSPDSRLLVQARAVDVSGGPAAGAPGPWIEIDRLQNQVTRGWVRRAVALPEALTAAGALQLRFVARDDNAGAERGGVEAAIDDLEITAHLPSCYAAAAPGETPADAGGTPAAVAEDDGGCGCRIGGAPPAGRGAGVIPLLSIVAGGLGRGLARRWRRATSCRPR